MQFFSDFLGMPVNDLVSFISSSPQRAQPHPLWKPQYDTVVFQENVPEAEIDKV